LRSQFALSILSLALLINMPNNTNDIFWYRAWKTYGVVFRA
jgi:hypothetical protein